MNLRRWASASSSMTLDDCENILDRALSSASETAFCYSIDPLFAEYEILCLELDCGSIFWRAPITDAEPFATLSELHYPSPEHARIGRLNGRWSARGSGTGYSSQVRATADPLPRINVATGC